MKNKAPLPLMEQLIMILVFALTAALCLQGFSLADRMSRRHEAREKAVVMAQNTAETLKACFGDFEAACSLLGGSWDETAWKIPYDKSGNPLTTSEKTVDNPDFMILATRTTSDHDLLGTARIQVIYEEETIFEITIAWQEVNTDAVP